MNRNGRPTISLLHCAPISNSALETQEDSRFRGAGASFLSAVEIRMQSVTQRPLALAISAIGLAQTPASRSRSIDIMYRAIWF